MDGNSLTISEVIKKLLHIANITEAELARRTSMPTATLNKLKTGAIDDPRISTLKTIAEYFNITVDQLIGEQSVPNVFITDSSIKIPLFNLNELINFNKNHLSKYDNQEYIKINSSIDNYITNNHNKLFATKVSGESMHPQFEDKTIIVCSSEKKAKNRDFVVAYIKKINSIIFRQFFLDSQVIILKSINGDFPIITLSDDDYIIGTIIMSIKNYL